MERTSNQYGRAITLNVKEIATEGKLVSVEPDMKEPEGMKAQKQWVTKEMKSRHTPN